MAVDWEYSGICDPAFDLALFINGMELKKSEKVSFISIYGIENDDNLEKRIDTYLQYGRLPSLLWCFDRLFNPMYSDLKKERVRLYLTKAKSNIYDLLEQDVLENKESLRLFSALDNS